MSAVAVMIPAFGTTASEPAVEYITRLKEGLPKASLHPYCDAKLNVAGLAPVVNVEGAFPLQIVQLQNAASAVVQGIDRRRLHLFQWSRSLLCVHHLMGRTEAEIIVLAAGSPRPESIARSLAVMEETGRPYERIFWFDCDDHDHAFVFDKRSRATQIAVATAVRLYQTGDMVALAAEDPDFVLGAAYAAAIARPEQSDDTLLDLLNAAIWATPTEVLSGQPVPRSVAG